MKSDLVGRCDAIPICLYIGQQLARTARRTRVGVGLWGKGPLSSAARITVCAVAACSAASAAAAQGRYGSALWDGNKDTSRQIARGLGHAGRVVGHAHALVLGRLHLDQLDGRRRLEAVLRPAVVGVLTAPAAASAPAATPVATAATKATPAAAAAPLGEIRSPK